MAGRVKVCVFAPFLLLAGCSAFFSFNALKGLDKVAAPNPNQYNYAINGAAGLNQLAKDLSSPAIVNALIGDPSATSTIENNLLATYTNTIPGVNVPLADQQLAAALYGDINLKTTSGDQFVNNVVNVVMSGTGSGQTIQQLLQGIVPASVASNLNAFTNMVNGLVNAESAYQVLGATLVPEPAPAPPGVNMGDTAQKSAVAYIMQSILYEIGGSTASATQQMFNLLNNQPNTVPTSPIDPFATPIAPYTETNLNNIHHIFACAGATMPS